MHDRAVCLAVPPGAEGSVAADIAARTASRADGSATFVAPGLVVNVVEVDEHPLADDYGAMDVVIQRIAGAGGTRHALRYPIRHGMADIADRVFRNSDDPPLMAGSTRLLSTSVYRQGDTFVRVFAIDGHIDELVDGLAHAVEVHAVGRQMAGLFDGGHEFTTRDGLRRFFSDNLMRRALGQHDVASEASA
jgi:hypothetical protein